MKIHNSYDNIIVIYTMVLVNTQFWLAGGCQLTFDMQTPMERLKKFQLNILFTVPN